MKRQEKDALARRRAAVILKVQSGRITATGGARELGVSRKTYYEWEKKALEGLVEALEDRPTGRPSKKRDPKREKLTKEVAKLQEELEMSRAKLRIQEVMMDLGGTLPLDTLMPRDKKKAKKKKKRKEK